MEVADWLDAGYVMLVENADPEVRGMLDDLFTAETEADMYARYDVLQAEADAREAEAKRTGRAPRRRFRRLREGEIEAAAAEWDQIIAEAQAK